MDASEESSVKCIVCGVASKMPRRSKQWVCGECKRPVPTSLHFVGSPYPSTPRSQVAYDGSPSSDLAEFVHDNFEE